MSASTPTGGPVKLRSPFNGEIWTVPPDCTPAFVEALIARGFVRVDDEAPKSPRAKKD